MHFRASVPKGDELCGGLAGKSIGDFNKLAAGDATGAVADLSDTEVWSWRRLEGGSVHVR